MHMYPIPLVMTNIKSGERKQAGVYGQPELPRELKASLGLRDPVSKKEKNKK